MKKDADADADADAGDATFYLSSAAEQNLLLFIVLIKDPDMFTVFLFIYFKSFFHVFGWTMLPFTYSAVYIL